MASLREVCFRPRTASEAVQYRASWKALLVPLPHTERMQLFLSSYSGTPDEVCCCSWEVQPTGQLCGKTRPALGLPACFPITNVGLVCRKDSSAWRLVAWDQGSFFLSRGRKTNALFIPCLCFKMRNFPWLLTLGVAVQTQADSDVRDGTSDSVHA